MKIRIKDNIDIYFCIYFLIINNKQYWIFLYIINYNMKKADLVVLFGATGNTGFHTANALLDSGYAVRIVVRSRQKVT
jgi:hypothetical protein